MTRRPVADFLRFTRGERLVHKFTAILMGICLATAAILYVDPLSRLTGHRAVVEWIHVIAGISLPVPFIIGLLSKAFRADAQRLNRFARTDWRWLRVHTVSRQLRHRDRLPVGKFNAGQKLNANFQLGAILVMLGTGTIMRFANHWPVYLRTGATFVHDWLAYGLLFVVVGHIIMANRDPDALRGMRTGYVPAAWAKREHIAWAEREHAAWVARERARSKATDAS